MPHPSSGQRLLTEEYLQGYTDGRATGRYEARPPFAAAELEAITEELEASARTTSDNGR